MFRVYTADNKIVFTTSISDRYSVEYVLDKDEDGNYVLGNNDLEILEKLLEKNAYILSDILIDDSYSNINIIEDK